MARKWIASLVALASAWAQPAIAPPSLGFMQDSARALRPVYGLAGNFILGPSLSSKIVSAGFSGSIGLLKTDSSLAAFDSQGKLLASMDAPSGPALLAFSPSGTSALVYVESSNALVEWRAGTFAPLAFHDAQVAGDGVLAIAFPTPYEALLIVQRKNGIWELTFPLGAVGQTSQKALIGVQAPLLAVPSGDLVYRGSDGLVVRRLDASEVRLHAALPASYSLQQMDREWVQLTDLNSSARFAIHILPGHEAVYQLPESSQ